jgi:hypothetical protein
VHLQTACKITCNIIHKTVLVVNIVILLKIINTIMASYFTDINIGFVGLGIMGIPMVENLVKKLPLSSKIYVFDISAAAVERICNQNQGRVFPCYDSKGVATVSVSKSRFLILPADFDRS